MRRLAAGDGAKVVLDRPAGARAGRRRLARGAGVWASEDGAASWSDAALPAQDVFSVALGPDGELYAGCEPSALYVRRDGEPWRELATQRELPSAPTWSFLA